MRKILITLIVLTSHLYAQQQDTSLARRIREKEANAVLHQSFRVSGGSIPNPMSAPEQDCNSAIPVCQNTYNTAVSYSGSGNSQEIPSNTCLGSNELNSVWYTFTTGSSGNLAFNITPNNSSDDYDFALYDITGSNCNGISSGAITPVRCNYSATSGVTGLSSSGTNASEPASGSNQSTVLSTTPGRTYVLIISNYSSSQSGYTLDFSPGTASIFDNIPPTAQSVTAPCGATNITFNASEQVKCSSIAANGSDFTITGTGGPYTISGASGVNCGTNSGQVTINFSPALSGGGPWTIAVQSGSDGNTLIDACGNAMAPTTMTFNTSPPTASISGPSSVCKGTVFALSANAGTSYNWTGSAVPAGQNNQQTISVTPNTPGTLNFTVQVGNGSCGSSTATKAVTVTDAPVANFSALPSFTVCAGSPITFTNTSTYPCSTGGLGVNQCTCGTFLCQTTPNNGTFVTYLWTFGDGGTAFYIAGTPAAAFSPTHTYSSPGTYIVSLTASGTINTCSSVKNLTVTVLPATANLTVSPSATICPGQSATLTVSGGTSYTWTPSASLSSASAATVTANPASTTIYTVSAPGCSSTQSQTVSVTVNGTPPNIGTIQGPSSVCNNATGVTYSVSSVASTTYTWSAPAGVTITSGANSNVVTVDYGASAGTISVTAASACGTATATLLVSISPSLSLTITPNNPTICGGGSATLTASGATSYTWSPSASLSSASGSSVTATPAATTNYTILGASGTCTGSATATVTVAGSLNLSVSQSNPGSCTVGSSTLVASGASTYTWSPAATLNTANGATVIANPSSTTTYTVVGSSGAGCTGTTTAIVAIGVVLSATTTQTNVSCNTFSDGIATANPSGGTGPYTYTWSTVPTQTTQTATGLGAGTYTVTIGSTECSASGLELINNGDFESGNTGFSSAYAYTPPPNTQEGQYWVSTSASPWNGGMTSAGDHTSGSGNFMLVNGAGTANVNVYCQTVPVTANTNYLFSTWLSNLTAGTPPSQLAQLQFYVNGVPLGSVFTSPSAVNTWAQFSASWNSGANTSANICIVNQSTSLGGNDFGLDDISFQQCLQPCPITQTVTITQPPAVTVSVSSNTLICPGQSTTLTAGGASTYTWSPAATLSSANGATVTANPSALTVYTVTGADAGGCTATNTVQVDMLGNISLTVSPASTTICPSATVTLSASGANSYTWAPAASLSAANTATVSASPAATTVYTITGDSNGCTGTGTINVVVTNTLSITATAVSPTVCPTANTQISASGATNYTWSPATDLSSSSGATVTCTPTASNQYTVLGASGTCTATATVNITLANTPTVTTSASPTICSGSNAALTANGANTYTWSPTTGLSSSTGGNITAGPGTTTTYTVTGSSAQGCTSNTVVTVNVIATPTLVATASPSVICSGSLTTLAAAGASTYTWSPSASLSSANGAVVTGTPQTSTMFIVTGGNGTAPNMCTSNTTVQVNVIPTPTPGVSPDQTICFGQRIYLVATGGTTYTWTPAIGLSAPHGSSTYANPFINTTYVVTVSNNGLCTGAASVNITVNPLPVVNAGPDTTINVDETYELTGSGSGMLGWLPTDGNPLPCNYCPQNTVNPQNSTCYILEATNAFNCVNRDTMCITVTKDWDVFIPNAFTPNGNGVNDVFIPVGYGITSIDLAIFDRWGAQIFKSSTDHPGWDGKNKGKLCETGVYVWQAEIHTIAGYTVKRVGHVTLISTIK
ncbi:MAG: gliding motility-associated C-terminal domain-containing protein [Bacteroidetes bacterium]|nr:gliding motility-associated C-terminal domain-containing protein [Bacteroidota bacterium]